MTEATQRKKSPLKQLAYILFSILTTGVVFYYLFQNVSPTEVLAIVKEANRTALLAFLLLSFSMSFFRTWRYLIVLKSSGWAPSSISLFLVVLVRNFFSDLLPARLGTLIYVYIVNTRLSIPLSAAGCSFALAFLFDILALVPLVLIAALLVGGAASLNPTGLLLGAALLTVIVSALLFALPWCCSLGKSILSLLGDKKDWCQSLCSQLDDLRAELLTAQRGGIYLPLIVLSVCVRICKYSSLYFLLYALLSPLGYTLSQMAPAKIFVGLLVPEIAASLPISGIAGFGAYEGAWAFIFRLLGFPDRVADITAISHHLFTQVYGYSMGIGALLLLLLPFFKRSEEQQLKTDNLTMSRRQQFTMIAKAGCAAGVVAILIAGTLLFDSTGKNAVAEEREPVAVRESDRAQAVKFLSTLPGTIIFDSNRSGTFGIFKLSDSGKPQPLFDSPEEEMYPSASADGKQIAFAKSMSTARGAPSDIWIMDRDGKNARLLLEDGTFPSWSADGKTLYFERRRKMLMGYSFESGKIEKLFPVNKSMFRKYAVVKPRVSADGTKVAFTSDRKGRWNAWVADLTEKKSTHVGKGCEPTWYSNSKSVAWIYKINSNAGSGIFRFNSKQEQATALQDGGAPFGHEYFPTLADSDRLLLHSACPPEQHSHITDNYQIFVKDLPSGELIRLTFDGYTNRWPKLMPDTAP